ncbi:MAG: hypothetical protein COB81_03200 [Flavobacteriaceae bacterium]|nr:MAG: hypothetical protein COB81_03200 [Flavobacteriaceae bacterium]
MKEIIKKTGINFGLIFGFILSLITLYAFVIDASIFGNMWIMLIPFAVLIVLGLLAIGTAKKGLNGYISFKEAFTTFFVMIALGTLIATIVNILIFNVVAPEFKETVKEIQITKTTEMMESFNVPYEQIDEAIEKLKEDDQFSIPKQMLSYVMGLAIYSIFGLLLALILKRNNPELE